MKKRAFFLDRDGTVNVEVDYLHRPEDAVLIPGAAAAIRRLHEAGYLAVVVTNQAGVAKGLYPESDIAPVHAKLRELLAAEGDAPDAFYYCPHHPKFTGVCGCRKPAPGMLLRAARDLDIDLGRSVMVGDRMSDVEAGRRAGCAKSYLVRTGYGEEVLRTADVTGVPVAADLAAAVEDWLEAERR